MPFYRTADDPDDTIIGCSCHCEGLKATYFDDPPIVYLSLCFFRRLSWHRRLRVVWYILTHGNSWPDDIVLDRSTMRELAEWLTEKADKGGDANAPDDSGL